MPRALENFAVDCCIGKLSQSEFKIEFEPYTHNHQ